MKSTILLTTALFLASAPSPDAKTFSEFSAGFLASTNDRGLMASVPVSSSGSGTNTSAQLADLSNREITEAKNRKAVKS